jgi:hypothetical protein
MNLRALLGMRKWVGSAAGGAGLAPVALPLALLLPRLAVERQDRPDEWRGGGRGLGDELVGTRAPLQDGSIRYGHG